MLSFSIWCAYVVFIILDILSLGIKVSNLVKYSIIIVLFLHSAISTFVNQNQRNILSKTSLVTKVLFLASCADYFLLFTEHFTIGILCFIAVQYEYRNLLDLKILKILKQVNYKVIFCFFLLQGLFFVLFTKYFLYIVAGEYACLLIRNMFICWYHRKKTGFFLTCAITLLFLCDCNVMLANVTDYAIFERLIWIFYVPSQYILEKYVEV